MNAKVFISYRREDSAPYAGRLYDRLVARFGEERGSILHGKDAKTRSSKSMAIEELNFHNAFLAGTAIIASVLFAIVWARFNTEQRREQSSK